MKIAWTCCIILVATLAACGDNSIIYENNEALVEPYKIKVNEVKIESETDDSLSLSFSYTYNHSIPADEIKLFVMPDHNYWSTQDVKVSRGTNAATVNIGLSKSNMEKDNVTESDTTKLSFRFEHYQPTEYLGNVWGLDIPYEKHWTLK
jgi:hypothetical protein